jgi:exodeoxyribonuclease VII small subunit
MRKKASQTEDAALSFDQALGKLEQLVEEMEQGDLTLEAAMEKYAEGTRLSQLCQTQLAAAEKAVHKVIKESGGILTETDLDLPEVE